MMRATALFAAASLGLVAVFGGLMTLVWPEPMARRAILVSAVLALVVQLFAFAVARLSVRTNVIAGWGLGMLLRFVAVVVYALVAARSFGLPIAPALISLVAFFFVTSLVEPVLLKT